MILQYPVRHHPGCGYRIGLSCRDSKSCIMFFFLYRALGSALPPLVSKPSTTFISSIFRRRLPSILLTITIIFSSWNLSLLAQGAFCVKKCFDIRREINEKCASGVRFEPRTDTPQGLTRRLLAHRGGGGGGYQWHCRYPSSSSSWV